MRLVHHITRGYGHAQQYEGRWVVCFFDKYNDPCHFSKNPMPKILDFIDEE